jgi:dolichyl-phosphate beta-glucosyltransferase
MVSRAASKLCAHSCKMYRLGVSLSIVIPAYNEQQRLPSTLTRISAYLAEARWTDYEILVVDDGSTDSTAALVTEWSRGNAAIRLLRNPGNRGKGYAVRHGMQTAVGDWRLFSDADLSTPIEEIEKLFAATAAGAQIAIGSRALNRKLVGVHQSGFREAAGRVFNIVMRCVLGLPLHDTQCGFKLFSAEAAEQVFSRQRLDDFGFDAEALFIAQLKGFTITEVPVRWNDVAGTKVSLWNGARPFLDLFTIRRNQLNGLYR